MTAEEARCQEGEEPILSHLEAGMANALGKEFSDLDEDSRDLLIFFDYMSAWTKVQKEPAREGKQIELQR